MNYRVTLDRWMEVEGEIAMKFVWDSGSWTRTMPQLTKNIETHGVRVIEIDHEGKTIKEYQFSGKAPAAATFQSYGDLYYDYQYYEDGLYDLKSHYFREGFKKGYEMAMRKQSKHHHKNRLLHN